MFSNSTNDAWRIEYNDIEPNYPFVTKAVHGKVARAMYGVNYYPHYPIWLKLEQVGWFIHVLDLAISGQTLQNKKIHEDCACMVDWKKVVVQEVSNMDRIYIYGHSVDVEDLDQHDADLDQYAWVSFACLVHIYIWMYLKRFV